MNIWTEADEDVCEVFYLQNGFELESFLQNA